MTREELVLGLTKLGQRFRVFDNGKSLMIDFGRNAYTKINLETMKVIEWEDMEDWAKTIKGVENQLFKKLYEKEGITRDYLFNIKNKIYKKMRNNGWSIPLKYFDSYMQIHLNTLTKEWNKRDENDEDFGDLSDAIAFASDLLSALNSLEPYKDSLEVVDTIKLELDGETHPKVYVLRSIDGYAWGYEKDEEDSDWYDTKEEVYINFFKLLKEKYEEEWECNNEEMEE